MKIRSKVTRVATLHMGINLKMCRSGDKSPEADFYERHLGATRTCIQHCKFQQEF